MIYTTAIIGMRALGLLYADWDCRGISAEEFGRGNFIVTSSWHKSFKRRDRVLVVDKTHYLHRKNDKLIH